MSDNYRTPNLLSTELAPYYPKWKRILRYIIVIFLSLLTAVFASESKFAFLLGSIAIALVIPEVVNRINYPKFRPLYRYVAPIVLMIFAFANFGMATNAKEARNKLIDNKPNLVINTDEKTKELEAKLALEQSAKSKAEEENKKTKELMSQAVAINVDIPEEQDSAPVNPVEEVKQANIAYTRDTNGGTTQKLLDVLKVVDGDTIIVSEIGTLRLIGVDTPETLDPRKVVQCFGKEASDYTKQQMRGTKVWLEFDPTQGRLDKYGRTLAYVHRQDGFFLNKELIFNGYAHEYTYNTPYKYQADFKQAQKDAQNTNRGLWSPMSCSGDTTKAAVSSSSSVKSSSTASISTTPVYSAPKSVVPVQNFVAPASTQSGFIAGSCKYLNSIGMGNFRAGDPNYTSSRDRDGDGVACEF